MAPQVFFITGTSTGFGYHYVEKCLKEGDKVVATARNAQKVTAALGDHDDLLAVALDVTDPASAQAAAPAAGGAAAFAQFVPLILVFVIMYFLIMRPQQKKMRQHREMIGALKKGDNVITQGGILGKVVAVRDEEVEVEIAQGVRIRVVRATIAQVVNRAAPAAANS